MAAMDSFKGQGGIQLLLTAEEEARSVVAAARDGKLTRLKEAKDEAETEANLHRSQMEAEYKKIVSEASGSENAKRLDEETEKKIQNLKQCASKVSNDVVQMLMNCVTKV